MTHHQTEGEYVCLLDGPLSRLRLDVFPVHRRHKDFIKNALYAYDEFSFIMSFYECAFPASVNAANQFYGFS